VARLDQAAEVLPHVREPVARLGVDEAGHGGVDPESEELAIAEVEQVLTGPQRRFPPGDRRFRDVEPGGAPGPRTA